MQQAKKVVNNTFILYVQMAITVIISLYTTRLVLLALGTADFGLFNVLGGAIVMLMFLSATMASASQRFMSFFSGEGDIVKQKKIFNISLKMHLLIALIMVFLLEVLALFLFEGVLNIEPERVKTAQFIYQFLVVSTFFTILSVPYDAVVNAHENMLFVASLRILEVGLKFLIAIYITHVALNKLYVYGMLMALIPIVLFFLKQLYGHKKYEEVDINFKKYKDKTLFNEMFSFARWSFLGSSSSMIANYGQGIVVNIFFGTSVNAAQGVSSQVSGQLGAFANVMLRALNPVLAKSEGSGNRNLMLKASMLGSKFSFFLLVLFYVPIMIEMPYVFGVWLKEVPPYTIIFCRLLLIRNLIEQLFLTLDSSIAAVGDIKEYQSIIFFLNFAPILITFLLFSLDFEPQTMYITFIVYSLVKALIILYYSKKLCGLSIPFFVNKIAFPCAIVFVSAYIFGSIPNNLMELGFSRFLIVGVVSVLSFFTLVWFIGLTKEERLMIQKIGKGIFFKNNLNNNL